MLLLASALRIFLHAQIGASGVDFDQKIRPILEHHCFPCHGEATQKVGLRLDLRDAALAGSRFGTRPIIIPGNRTESLIHKRTSSEDPEFVMPPNGRPRLSGMERELIGTWIDEGAQWPPDDPSMKPEQWHHWAYIPPRGNPLPQFPDPTSKNPIDTFVAETIQAELGLARSSEADRMTLIRRLSLDLLGLPPEPRDVEEFVIDPSHSAYEDLVDRLLESPQYGEKQAQHWLDLARYADTHGFEKDARRTMWRYRDWVIDAYNQNMPFDQFTIEQLAGDLLDSPTDSQLIATGFHRNTMLNQEGGVDAEEYRVEALIDRVDTTSTVWLGTTLACAQCHDHKFDPFSQREYYQFFAFFNNSEDDGSLEHPTVPAPTDEQAALIAEIDPEIKRIEAELSTWSDDLEADFVAWERSARGFIPRWTPLDIFSTSSDRGASIQQEQDGALFVGGGEIPDVDLYTVEARAPLGPLLGIRLEALSDERLGSLGPGRASHGNIVLNEFTVEVASGDNEEDHSWSPVTIKRALADHSQASFDIQDSIDGNKVSGWALGGQIGVSHQAYFIFENPLDVEDVTHLRITLEQNYGNQHVLGKFRISVTRDAVHEESPLPLSLESWIVHGIPSVDAIQSLKTHYLSMAPRLISHRLELEELKQKRPVPPIAMIMRERKEPRETRIFERGSFLSPGETVASNVPSIFPPLGRDQPNNRLGLAQWLVDGRNPLVARVIVNRLWERYFGRGIVATSEDFGTQSDPPTHPKLLDWLALQFVDSGWNLKSLHRLILTSATYRQDAIVKREHIQSDPQNIYLGRFPRIRLPAETLRDQALKFASLLSYKLGGESVFPSQPSGIWSSTYNGDQWVENENEDRYRRGLYTFWKRTSPYPAFVIFDAPSREVICTRRARTNTPLQALALLNDPAFLEAAYGLAQRVMSEGGTTDSGRIDFAFRVCTSRSPTKSEMNAMGSLLDQQREAFCNDPENTTLFLKSFSGKHDLDFDAETSHETAAWTLLSNVILNLDETVTRG